MMKWVFYDMLRLPQDKRDAKSAFQIALAIALLDQLTKVAAVMVFSLHESLPVVPHLNIGYWRNTGAAFSFLADASGWQRPLLILIGTAASFWLAWLILASQSSRAERIAYALILGGAVSNVFDRVLRGAVVDWIDLYWVSWHWPAFNVADMGITAGAGIILSLAIMPGRTANREPPAA